jgi:small subunit ribosomal protein S20
LANIHSAQKAMRQSEKRRVRNRVVRASTRTQVKQANEMMAGNNAADAEKATIAAIRALDKAAEKGVIKKNNAARRKSRLMKKLTALRAAKK